MKLETPPRFEIVDLLRGIALLAMTLFHFGWDAELLGLVPKGFAVQPWMKWFAICIASSFLFLMGVSLVIAHGKGFKKKPFAIRLAKILSAALLVTIATYFATPDFYIFFGILHHIAIASILGLLFVKAPIWINVICVVLVLFAGINLKLDALSDPIHSWIGIGNYTPNSSDYVPLFPYFAAVLFGIATMQYILSKNHEQQFTRYAAHSKLKKAICFIGRNSLLYYLIHQPIMLGLMAGSIFIWKFAVGS